MPVTQSRWFRSSAMMCAVVFFLGCGGPAPFTVDTPLHLEEHLDEATIEGSEVPEDIPEPVEWRFDEPQPDWRPAKPIPTPWAAVKPVRVDDALRLPLTADNRPDDATRLIGTIYVDLPDWNLADWGYVEIRARAQGPRPSVGLYFNYTGDDSRPGSLFPFYTWSTGGGDTPLITDGTVQTYRLSLGSPGRIWDGPWTHLGIIFKSQPEDEAATLDILSVRVIPREAEFAGDRVGVEELKGGARGGFEPQRRTLYMHAPGRIAYPVRIPEDGRLDVGLGVLRDNAPVTFAITATLRDGSVEELFQETYADHRQWGQRTVDLSQLAGQTVTLALEAEAERAGAVALWAGPTLSGSRRTDKPNVIFYVIDGANAEHMSVYGYNRRTTPNLERLAAEGAVFERAYSNSSWTRPSTASFMISLQHSAMGGQRNGFNVVPEEVPTMAQHLHRAGYQTSVMTANPNAGRMSGLEREVDFFREDWEEFSYFGSRNHRQSSRYLHEAFLGWREAYPAEPYWVHFQTVDTHRDFPAVAPFSGLFIGPEQLRTWEEWNSRLDQAGGEGPYSEAWERTGISRVAFYGTVMGLWDETMAYSDYQIGRLVERLKVRGEWENTLLIVGSDHSSSPRVGIGIQDSLPPPWGYAMLRSSISRIPLMFIWPGRIEGGQRLSQPVSMIDVLPTILDLVGLPMPEVMQGQSLAPLLLGEEGWEPRPVILDEFDVDRETGQLRGMIEVVDGRWGASLEINRGLYAVARLGAGRPELRRPVPLLVYDLWNDPQYLHSLHEERPDLVEKYTAFLEAQFEAHQALAQLFTPSESVALTPEQLETLRALGYIQ
jgi:arylsulfatase A-like enzyme